MIRTGRHQFVEPIETVAVDGIGINREMRRALTGHARPAILHKGHGVQVILTSSPSRERAAVIF